MPIIWQITDVTKRGKLLLKLLSFYENLHNLLTLINHSVPLTDEGMSVDNNFGLYFRTNVNL